MIWNSEENLLKPAHMKLDIRKALGGRVKEDFFNPIVIRKRAFKTLAKSKDVQEILALFNAHFTPNKQLLSFVPQALFLSLNLLLNNHGRLLFFNQYRHLGCITSWSATSGQIFQAFHLRQKNAKLFKLIKMHWHQLAGAHAIACGFFTKEQSVTNILGMLITDDVGIEKSFFALLFAGFLTEPLLLVSK
ncbi:hypothetical protein EST38_g12414 [Candolleomyces aberdarensis]|uniref:Uncharacterized protein n=1 Tax=Candolleomyces aberdarensis TaxID=2316362 RepID=A0A4Q2D391_9AGAR|nr:hypothetical protein EST38_g12414 [Candolleomyces aberdarensis]